MWSKKQPKSNQTRIAIGPYIRNHILKEVVEIIKEQKKGSSALQARGRKLLKRLERKKTDV
jgi:hypothetical protein